ncbi:MAG: menaquinone biosynthesis decarboxylase [Candidatus Mycalebacterium zealandia]|nr:MAG: menaquinone biosynthesis decarboxylase [Candidatus Mycalebacterium zealandia]
MSKSFRNLREYVSHLEKKGDLKRIKTAVDPELEITEIAAREMKNGGPALLFENVNGSPFPLAINLFASEERIKTALGGNPRDVGEELVEIFEKINPPSARGIFSALPKMTRALSMRTANSWGGARVQKNEITPDLEKLPAIKCWPQDGGRFITFGLVITHSPVSGGRNMGLYRLQIYDSKTTGMHWHAHKGGAAHYDEAEKLGRDLEAAIVLGGDPTLIFSAIAPLPEGVDEVAFSGYLRRRAVAMTKGKSVSMKIPSEAEMIIEGIVPKNIRRTEGPFGDHFGHYSMQADFPVFQASRMTFADDAIFPATVVGKPPQEDMYLGIAAGEMFSPLIRIIHPEIKDMWACPEAGFHNLLFVKVDERYPKNAVKSMLALWGTGQLALTKCMITVSGDVNLRDFSAILEEVGKNFDPCDDFLLIPTAPLDTLDFTSGSFNVGSKMGINAVKKPGKPPLEYCSSVPDPREKHPEVKDWRLLAGGFFVAQIEGSPKGLIRRIFETPGFEKIRIAVLVSADIDIHDDTELIWGIFTRFDPRLDVEFEEMNRFGSDMKREGRMGIDATKKEWYPEVTEMTPEIKAKVSEKWNSYRNS